MPDAPPPTDLAPTDPPLTERPPTDPPPTEVPTTDPAPTDLAPTDPPLTERPPTDPTPTEVACVLCGRRDRWRPVLVDVADKRYQVEGRWDYRQCRACGLVALYPPPDDVAAGYPDTYSQHRARLPSTDRPGRSPARRWLRQHSLAGLGYRTDGGGGRATVAPGRPHAVDRLVAGVSAVRMGAQWGCLLVPAAKAGGRLLDVGCGAGRYLSVMRALGWEVHGVEPDDTSRGVAAEQGLGVVPSLAAGDFTAGSFDVLTMNHVIEHLEDPVAELRALRPLIGDGGSLGIATPNWSSATRKLFGPDWYALEPPRHLVLFDPRTLAATVEAAGFRVVACASRSVREGPQAWKLTWQFRRGHRPPRWILAAGAALSCAAAWVGQGEEIELWATPAT